MLFNLNKITNRKLSVLLIVMTTFCGGFSFAKVNNLETKRIAFDELEKNIEMLFNADVLKSSIDGIKSGTVIEKSITGLTCGPLSQFIQNNGIDETIRENALNSIKTQGSCLSDQFILSLKKIPIDKLHSNNSNYSDETKMAISCFNKLNLSDSYAEALRSSANKFWSGLSDKLKVAIRSNFKNQNVGLTDTEVDQLMNAEPDKTILKKVKDTSFCFAEITLGEDDKAKTNLVSVSKDSKQNEQLNFYDVSGSIIDIEEDPAKPEVAPVNGGGL